MLQKQLESLLSSKPTSKAKLHVRESSPIDLAVLVPSYMAAATSHTCTSLYQGQVKEMAHGLSTAGSASGVDHKWGFPLCPSARTYHTYHQGGEGTLDIPLLTRACISYFRV